MTKGTMFAEDVHPVSEFRSKAAGFITQVHNTKRPLVITQNGKSAAVLLDVTIYDSMVEKLELLQDVEIGSKQIDEGKGITHSEAHKTIRSKYTK
jgi:prevent-host-death family protein